MKTQYPHLFSPLRVGNVMLKNRIVSSPAGLPKAPVPSTTYYGDLSLNDRSLGGAGLVISCVYGNSFDPDPFSKYGNDTTRESLSVMKQGGAMAAFAVNNNVLSQDPEGEPKLLYPVVLNPEKTKLATTEEMAYIKEVIAQRAVNARNFGFDVVVMATGMGKYLLSKLNTRDDIYGGSLENRCRWIVELMQEVRKRVGNEFPIIADVGRTMGPTPENASEEETLYFCKQIEPYVNGFIIRSGWDKHWESIENNRLLVYNTTAVFIPKEYNLDFCAKLKQKVSVPVFLNGGVTGDPEVAEDWIAQGKIDGVTMARQLFADPFWAKKAEEGRSDDITPCLRCNYCYTVSTKHYNTQCSVNPRYRRENRVPLSLTKTTHPKRVVVVGGGPAGMKAALTAYEKGHLVTLIEKSDRLGGMINYADYGKYKKELKAYRDYLVNQVNKSAIRVLYHTTATKELLEKMDPEGLIIAIGASPVTPKIKGIENATQILEFYDKLHALDGKIAIIGGGAIGTEAALELAEEGKDVYIIEMMSELASKENWLYRFALQDKIKNTPHLHVLVNQKVVEIGKDSVEIQGLDGKIQQIPTDHIFYSIGMKSKKDEAFALYGVTPNTTMIGDCRNPGHVLECTNDGYFVGANI